MEALGVNGTFLLIQIINVSILIFVLNKIVYKPVLQLLEKRKKKIEEGLVLTEKLQKEQEKLEIHKKKIIEEANLESRLIIDNARKSAKVVEDGLLKEAKIKADNVVEKSKADLVIRQKEMEKMLQTKMVDAVMSLTQKLIGDLLDQDKKQLLIKKRLDHFLRQKSL